jgi:hypothetical protein
MGVAKRSGLLKTEQGSKSEDWKDEEQRREREKIEAQWIGMRTDLLERCS